MSWSNPTHGKRNGRYVYTSTVGAWRRWSAVRSETVDDASTGTGLIDDTLMSWNETNEEVQGVGVRITTDSTTPTASTRVNIHGHVHVTKLVAPVLEGNIVGDITGNATTATGLASSRTISLTGDLDGSASFNGTANAVIAGEVQNVRGVSVYTGTTAPTGTTRLNIDGHVHATRVYNAVWNDIVDFIDTKEVIKVEFGRAYCRDRDGHHYVSENYMPTGLLGIASDTYGFGVGHKSEIETTQLPIAIGGIVLAYVDQEYDTGTPLTATTDGTLTEMSENDRSRNPERILATYYRPEPNSQWNTINVDGRHWVKVR